MKSKVRGKSTSQVEVSNIDVHGFWLYVEDKEYFLPFEEYPWFKNAKVKEILNVHLLYGCHLYWPDLDVDLELSCIASPDKYPLKYRS
ncbi:MAG: DUF2442 domain-containing protein [Planctomycetota bacterium]